MRRSGKEQGEYIPAPTTSNRDSYYGMGQKMAKKGNVSSTKQKEKRKTYNYVGPRKDPNNYRGISVTSTMSRLYEKILRNLIEEEYSSYEEEKQNGFRGGRSCTDNILH
ncbi:uncharacterized protein LOC115874297 [Sitophilus oryzae]|uniref:Uncharacterized protein LOC115874297 n=1 Tax=Sitophilus oryzae TaxID=7048 RepID=A0A6J2X2R2_SITOR|nr:uncharacterized protein LOC115874297 [Sitophilus oryzae]